MGPGEPGFFSIPFDHSAEWNIDLVEAAAYDATT